MLNPASFDQAATERVLTHAAPTYQHNPSHNNRPGATRPCWNGCGGRAPAAAATAPVDRSRCRRDPDPTTTVVQPHRALIGTQFGLGGLRWMLLSANRCGRFLHQPAFQALEATWRGNHGLITLWQRAVQVFLLDVTQSELMLDLRAAAISPSATSLSST
ncbi:MAG: type VI secretion system contractile sheath large subunit [Candidatus Competibacteraceae bacterium]|nr:type VI secretion system contractile sheath large subunit [Candidatus Competibacteraceae bacterium]